MWDTHLCVQSKAGCGKSTRAYQLAEDYFKDTGLHSLILTFSSVLKTEGRERVHDQEFITVHSFHSSIVELFGHECHTNPQFDAFLKVDAIPLVDLSNIGLLGLDELQDSNKDIHSYISKLRAFLHPNHKLMNFGDMFQTVFSKLQMSSPKYLQDPVAHFGGEFRFETLDESYRLSPNMCSWINQNLDPNAISLHFPTHWKEKIAQSWGTGIKSHVSNAHKQEPVDFHRFSFYRNPIPESVVQCVKRYIRDFGASSVLIIVKSCKFNHKHPAAQIIRQCPEAKWIVLSSDVRENAELLANKSVVATVFKTKGCQFRCVVVCGLDASIEQDCEPELAFAEAYTECSRASDKLIILSDSAHPLFFTMRQQSVIQQEYIPNTVNVANLVTYNIFDPVWDSLQTRVVHTQEPIALENQVQIGDGFEFVGTIYTQTLRAALISSLSGSEFDWIDLVQTELEQTFCHTQRQLSNPENWVDTEKLDALLDSALELLPECEEFQPRKALQADNVFGFVYLLLDDTTLVNVACTPEFEYSQGQEILLLGELLNEPTHRVFIVNPCAGETREIFKKAGLVQAMLKRKRL